MVRSRRASSGGASSTAGGRRSALDGGRRYRSPRDSGVPSSGSANGPERDDDGPRAASRGRAAGGRPGGLRGSPGGEPPVEVLEADFARFVAAPSLAERDPRP